MHTYLKPLKQKFEENRNPENAFWMKKYMKDQYEFFGIKTPARRAILSSFIKEYGPPDKTDLEPVIRECWSMEERDWQYTAIELMNVYKRNFDKGLLGLLEFMIVNKSWWDTVDAIASSLAGTFFKKFPDMIPSVTAAWMDSGNIWLQRTCLLFQLQYKKDTDTKLLFGFIEKLSEENSFWIRKAIGWVLREYSKTDPETVLKFVESHKLSNLSRKEALKVITRKKG